MLDTVHRHWAPEVDYVEHLPVGWGGHHWRAEAAGEPLLFVTLDIPLARHTPASLEGAYGAAAAVAGELEFVWPSLATYDGRFTVALSWGTLSVTRWLEGERPAASTPDLRGMLARLHDVAPPRTVPRWRTLVQPTLAQDVARLVSHTWSSPLGPVAHELVSDHLADVARWAREHARLLARVDRASYVLTHGEPGDHNQWQAAGRVWLIDWETLLLAPRERDLATLVRDGVEVDHDAALVRLFDLEWRLSEIWSFATWLEQPHADGPDDRQALAGLRDELTRSHVDER